MKNSFKYVLSLMSILIIPSISFAHTGSGHSNSFTMGFLHPLLGLDHLLAIISLGVWSVQSNAKNCWKVTAVFLVIMLLGWAVGINSVESFFIERGILASVFLLSLLIILDKQVSNSLALILVSAFAFFHGHVHGTEMIRGISVFSYCSGFLSSTVMLNLFGIILGKMLSEVSLSNIKIIRFVGVAILFSAFVFI